MHIITYLLCIIYSWEDFFEHNTHLPSRLVPMGLILPAIIFDAVYAYTLYKIISITAPDEYELNMFQSIVFATGTLFIFILIVIFIIAIVSASIMIYSWVINKADEEVEEANKPSRIYDPD